MRLLAKSNALHEIEADWLIVGAWENEGWTGALADLDAKLGGVLTRLRERGDITGKPKSLTPLYHLTGIKAARLLVVGLGPRKIEVGALNEFGAVAARSITGKATKRVAVAIPSDIPDLDQAAVVRAAATGFWHGTEGPGLRKSKPDRFAPDEAWMVSPGASSADFQKAVNDAEIEARGVSLARELVNLPPCDLFPESFAERARQVSKEGGIECLVLDEKQLEAERMQSLLAVARGSDKPARLVVMRLKGPGKTLGLVGKGVTFDSGGLSLKTNEQMVDMKCDMAGAAAVLGAMQAIAALKIPVNVIGVLALVENLPSGKAMKLGDVLRARNGKTIEVLNTDAEGRLILADALSYTVDQKADHLVDLATLTGACMIALGTEVAGVMSNDESWSTKVLAAARVAGEKAWPLPMLPHYSELIKSDVADMRNTGGTRYAGAISAAKFLEEFVAGTPWVHLDIAGPAWAEHDNAVRDSGGTGCFVKTLVQLARDYAQA